MGISELIFLYSLFLKESRGPELRKKEHLHNTSARHHRSVSTQLVVRIVVGGLCRFLACQLRLMFFLLIIKTTSYCLHHVGTSAVRCNYLRHGSCWPPQLPISLGFTLHGKKEMSSLVSAKMRELQNVKLICCPAVPPAECSGVISSAVCGRDCKLSDVIKCLQIISHHSQISHRKYFPLGSSSLAARAANKPSVKFSQPQRRPLLGWMHAKWH